MTVRSAVLGRWVSTAASNHLFMTVPPGMTALIKSINLTTGAGTAGTSIVFLQAPNAGQSDYLLLHTFTASEQVVAWNGWVVADEGTEIRAYSEPPAVTFLVSGSMLSGVANIPPVVATQ